MMAFPRKLYKGDDLIEQDVLTVLAEHVNYGELRFLAGSLNIRWTEYQQAVVSQYSNRTQILEVLHDWHSQLPETFKVKHLIHEINVWRDKGYVRRSVWKGLKELIHPDVLNTHAGTLPPTTPRAPSSSKASATRDNTQSSEHLRMSSKRKLDHPSPGSSKVRKMSTTMKDISFPSSSLSSEYDNVVASDVSPVGTMNVSQGQVTLTEDDSMDINEEIQEGAVMYFISLLFLMPKWQFDSLGVSGIIHSLIRDLRVVDEKAQGIHITCAVVQKERKISDKDRNDAKQHKVELKGTKLFRGMKGEPTIELFDVYSGAYLQDVLDKECYHFIIGSIPYLANGALNIKDYCKKRGHYPKILLIAHDLPNKENLDEYEISEWLQEADVILSLGDPMKSQIDSYIQGLDENKPDNKCYIPGCPTDLLTIRQENRSSTLEGPQTITVITQGANDLNASDLDFQLAVESTTKAATMLLDRGQHIRITFMMLTSNKEAYKLRAEFEKWKKDRRVTYQFQYLKDMAMLRSVMKRTKVLLLPLKQNSVLFGVEALEAAYSGVPILVSNNSGLASLLESLGEGYSIVRDTTGDREHDTNIWSERIIRTLMDPIEASDRAQILRKEIILDCNIGATHADFMRIVCEPEGDIRLQGFHNKSIHVNVEERGWDYIVKVLALQRNKIDLGALDPYLASGIKEIWHNLERLGLELLHIEPGGEVQEHGSTSWSLSTPAELQMRLRSGMCSTERVESLQITFRCPKVTKMLQKSIPASIWMLSVDMPTRARNPAP